MFSYSLSASALNLSLGTYPCSKPGHGWGVRCDGLRPEQQLSGSKSGLYVMAFLLSSLGSGLKDASMETLTLTLKFTLLLHFVLSSAGFTS